MRIKMIASAASVFLACEWAGAKGLPQGYTELEFIRGDGQGYLDTGYTPNSTDFGFFLDCVYLDEVAQNGNSILMGSSKRNNGSWGGLTLSGWAAQPGGQLIFCRTRGDAYDPHLVRGERMQIELVNGHYSISTGVSFDMDVQTSGYFNGPVYVFTMNRDDKTPAETGMMKGRVYRLKFYKGDAVIHDFVPAKDEIGNVGLYDVVGDLGFKKSATASQFLAPTCMSLVYVAATGAQYLDTGYTPTSKDVGFALDFLYEDAVAITGYATIFGSSLRNDGRWGGLTLAGYATHPGGQLNFCKENVFHDPGLVANKRLQVQLMNRTYVSSTGMNYPIEPETAKNFNGSLWLGKIHADVDTVAMKGRFYGLKLFEGEHVERAFVPCVDLASERAGFQELFSEKFYPSASTVDFIAGPGFNTLTINSALPGVGQVDQGFGAHEVTSGLTITASRKWVDPETGLVYACTGWRLLDESGAEIDTAEALVCKYEGAGMARELVWDWAIYRLPEQGFELVEYIVSDGTQVADLGIAADETTRVIYDFQYTAVDTAARTLNGWGSAQSADAFSWGHAEASKCTCWEYFSSAIGSGWEFESTRVELDTERHVFDLAPGCQSFDGHVYAHAIPVSPSKTREKGVYHEHLYVGAQHGGWNTPESSIGTVAANTKERIFRCKVYSGETLLADLIPCVRTQGQVAGLYDVKRRTFLQSFADTAFIPGPKVEAKPLPGAPGLVIVVQ